MAKRKRLTPANPTYLSDSGGPLNTGMRAPIAEVASEAAATAALRDVTAAMTEARDTGRMVAQIPLDQIDMTYLVRDRASFDEAEMETLVASIQARGQQTPIEVVDLGPDAADGRYGLISGWRRCQALLRLARDGDGPDHALALMRAPQAASDAYIAMVEENEIRVGLSYYERARIALKAAEQGVFDDVEQALRGLFGTASRPKRSKIRSFVGIVQRLDGVLRHPHRMGERQGLLLAKRLEDDPAFVSHLARSLSQHSDGSAEGEQTVLSTLLSQGPKTVEPAPPAPKRVPRSFLPPRALRDGLMVQEDRDSGAVHLWGDSMTPALRARLLAWLKTQG